MGKKLKEYFVSVKVLVDTTVTVRAESFEDALIKGRELDVKDVVEFDTDYNDGSIEVSGVYKI